MKVQRLKKKPLIWESGYFKPWVAQLWWGRNPWLRLEVTDQTKGSIILVVEQLKAQKDGFCRAERPLNIRIIYQKKILLQYIFVYT